MLDLFQFFCYNQQEVFTKQITVWAHDLKEAKALAGEVNKRAMHIPFNSEVEKERYKFVNPKPHE